MPSKQAVIRQARSRIVKVAAAMLQGVRFLSPSADDYLKERIPRRSVIDAAQAQQEQLREWSIELREVYDSLSAIESPPPPSIEAPRVETIRCTHCANRVAVKEEGGTSLIEAHGECPDRRVRGNWRDDPTYRRIFPEPEDKQ